MLQDININPVQPSLAEPNLSLLTRGGPFKPGFNEYTPLFERNDVQFQASGLEGNEATHGFEGIVSALYDRFSISAGAFRFETDGWRPDNEIQHDVQNFFMQAAVTPDLNMQVELRRRESQEGDLEFNFDPNFFEPGFTRFLNQDTARFGARYSPTPNSDVLVSFIHSSRNERDIGISSDFPIVIGDKADQVESQYIYEKGWLNLIAGFEFTNSTGQTERPVGLVSRNLNHTHPYVYTNVKFPTPVTWTLGVAYDDFARDQFTVKKPSPKLGVQWDVTNNLSIRGAVFRWVKPQLSANRTLEPTQVSGFNQLFDDVNGTESWRRGVGLDWRVTKQFFAGAEATWRSINVPVLVGARFCRLRSLAGTIASSISILDADFQIIAERASCV